MGQVLASTQDETPLAPAVMGAYARSLGTLSILVTICGSDTVTHRAAVMVPPRHNENEQCGEGFMLNVNWPVHELMEG